MNDDDLLDVVVLERAEQADRVISLELARPGGEPLPAAEAGAHIDLHLDSVPLVRQYSLAGDPADQSRYRIGVLLESRSRGGSQAVHADAVIGAKLSVSAPRNSFRLPAGAGDVVLVGGGIGITPLLAMGYDLAARGVSFTLHHRARSRAAAAFAGLLEAAPFAGHAFHYFDDPGAAGPFDARALLGDPQPGRHVMICDPQGFMDHVTAASRAAGWGDDQVHTERFRLAAGTAGGDAGRAFTVRAARSGKTVTVTPSQTILDALLDAGIEVETSCEVGICGTCLTRVIEGVPDHRDEVLTPEEKAQNTEMTICCSRSLSGTLVLDI